MKIFHIKSILLGIGIGVVLTSVISMIYLAGKNPSDNLSPEYIKSEAKKLGMVENTALLNEAKKAEQVKESSKNQASEKTKTEAANSSDIKNNNEVKPKEEAKKVDQKDTMNTAQEQAKPEPQEIKISVNPGDSSEKVADKLLGAGLISNKENFLKELSNMGLASEINIGEFKIKQGTAVRDIIKRLTSAF